MNKSSLVIILGIFYLYSFSFAQSSELGKRWLFAPDPLLQFPLINKQNNFFDRKLPLGKDWVQGFGFELLKYYPNKKYFYIINARIFEREAIVNTFPVTFIRENGAQINLMMHQSKQKVQPYYLNISKFFAGLGLSYTYIIDNRLDYFARGYTQNSKDIFNKHRIEGLVNVGLLEDVFNISKKTSLSKFNILFRIPVLNISNTFNNKYIETDSEIEEYQKSNGRKLSIELQYSHLLDLRKNKTGNYEVKLDTIWNEVTDPIKNFIPPIVNNGLPKKNFYGNFYFEMILFRSQDSVYGIEMDENFALFKKFNGFGFGYTLNFMGNYRKDYSKDGTGGEIYNQGKGWRRNLFVSGGYKQMVFSANKTWNNIDFFAPIGVVRSGIKLRNSKNNYELAFGAGYQKMFAPQTFLNHVRTETPDIPTTSIFAAYGYLNHLIKIEYEMKDFNFTDPYKSFNLVYSIGI